MVAEDGGQQSPDREGLPRRARAQREGTENREEYRISSPSTTLRISVEVESSCVAGAATARLGAVRRFQLVIGRRQETENPSRPSAATEKAKKR